MFAYVSVACRAQRRQIRANCPVLALSVGPALIVQGCFTWVRHSSRMSSATVPIPVSVCSFVVGPDNVVAVSVLDF